MYGSSLFFSDVELRLDRGGTCTLGGFAFLGLPSRPGWFSLLNGRACANENAARQSRAAQSQRPQSVGWVFVQRLELAPPSPATDIESCNKNWGHGSHGRSPPKSPRIVRCAGLTQVVLQSIAQLEIAVVVGVCGGVRHHGSAFRHAACSDT